MCCNFCWQFGCGSNSRCCNRCCNQCGCGQRCCGQSASAAEYFVNYRYRFVDVPMQVYYGPGYTERNVLESIDDSLQAISQRPCGC